MAKNLGFTREIEILFFIYDGDDSDGVGGILFNLPAGAIPHIILVVGGVVWSIGAVWFGTELWSKQSGYFEAAPPV